MSSQNKALLLSAPRSTQFEIASLPIPKPQSGQLLVKVAAAALNPADWKIPEIGLFTESYPIVLGLDGAGTVEDIGPDVTGFNKGDRV